MSVLPPHPHGVLPEGNLWVLGAASAAAARASRSAGLGTLGQLSDATLIHTSASRGDPILSFSAPRELAALCATSDVMSAFASSEELWRAACLERLAGATMDHYSGSWKATYAAAMRKRVASAAKPAPRRPPRTRGVSVYSDALYRDHDLTHSPTPFGPAPSGPPCTRIRRDAAPDAAAFAKTFEAGAGRPVVLEGGGAQDVVSAAWDEASLRDRFGDRVFHAGGVNFRLRDYLQYANTNTDEQPLYLFDPTFGSTAPELLKEYTPPAYFRDDLFELLDERDAGGGGGRPSYRWLLIGGARSGQSWHKDPNDTSAWNLTVRGRKRWLFFPPNVVPPGVIPSADGDGFVTPISLAEWARAFYAEACATPGCLETYTTAGDVVFVPRLWWHMVVNMEPCTVAVSHHFLSPAGLHATLRMLRERPHHVSGVDRGLKRAAGLPAGQQGSEPPEHPSAPRPDGADDAHARRTAAGAALHDRLVAALRERRPGALARAEEELRALAAPEKHGRVSWRALIADTAAAADSPRTAKKPKTEPAAAAAAAAEEAAPFAFDFA